MPASIIHAMHPSHKSGEPRSPEEQELFEESLNYADLWYAHSKTEKWLISRMPTSLEQAGTPPYPSRDWTFFESAVAEFLAGDPARSMVLDIDKNIVEASDAQRLAGADFQEWPEICRLCTARRQPPRTPQQFAIDLASKESTNPSDSDVLQKRYAEAFDTLVASSKQLTYRNLAWGDQEALKLCPSLKMCTNLQSLDLDRNLIADEGLSAIMEVLVECPDLERLVLSTNRMGDESVQFIAKVLPKCASLRVLDLSFNFISNFGAQALLNMFENDVAHPALTEMLLNGNDIGASMKRSLRAVVQAKQGSSFRLYV